jgi:hypothetical protein
MASTMAVHAIRLDAWDWVGSYSQAHSTYSHTRCMLRRAQMELNLGAFHFLFPQIAEDYFVSLMFWMVTLRECPLVGQVVTISYHVLLLFIN